MSLQEKTIGRSLCPVRVVYILLALSRIFMDGASALEKDTSPGSRKDHRNPCARVQTSHIFKTQSYLGIVISRILKQMTGFRLLLFVPSPVL